MVRLGRVYGAAMTKAPSGYLALLAEADLLLLLSRLFSPPAPELRAELDAAEPCFAELVDRAGLNRRKALTEAFAGACADGRALELADWAGEYNRMFERDVPCPINESGFVRRDKGAILGDIDGFYRAFGFTLAEDASEKVDHLVCELEFLAMLFVMLAKARAVGNKEATRVSRHAICAFTQDHLGEWLPAFCEKLMETTTLSFYWRAAALLLGVWQGISKNNGLPPPGPGAATAVLEEGTPYECGMAEAGAI